MESMKRMLPLGIQDFEKLRKEGCLYIDKTEIIHKLLHDCHAVFLSRPRRFGKSLLLSTIKHYFLGEKELFEGLEIERLEAQSPNSWEKYPVLYFDFNGQNYTKEGVLEDTIDYMLQGWEKEYEISEKRENDTLSTRFETLLKVIYEKTGKRVVVLVDEYDKSLLETMTAHPEIEESNRATFKGFFGLLKKMDAYLQFYMFTGVTKFSKVSIFSDLNQLTDISLNPKYNNICGISQSELESTFAPEISEMAEHLSISKEECLSELKQMYDGYHFSANGEGMYNPFSLLHAFYEADFGSYWFESGTPTFLVNKLKQSNYDIRKFSEKSKISEKALRDYRPENPDPIPLFYQSGYLTIKGFNHKQRSYTLDFPNSEVRYGFYETLAPTYLNIEDKPNPFNIDLLDDAIEEGNTDGMRDWFTSLFALLPYPAGSELEKVTEQNFQNVIFMTFTMMGKYARTEVHSAKGRADCILETSEYIYIFEFKCDSSAADALNQIEEQGYTLPYASDKRRIFKIGVNFSRAEKNIVEWEVKNA